MRSELFSIFGESEQAMEKLMSHFLQTPGNHRLLHTYLLAARSEILGMLYDEWAMVQQYPAAKTLGVFIDKWNVDVGQDTNQNPQVETLYEEDLFMHDLHELCVAINTYMQTGELTPEQVDYCTKAEDYYRSLGGANPGAISVKRGWHELMRVIREHKRLSRCVAPGCGRILIHAKDGTILFGTPQGYHSERCLETHTRQHVSQSQMPGAQDVSQFVRQVSTHGEGQTDTPPGEHQPAGSGEGPASVPGGTTSQ